jgi:predicted nucleotidyltransferase component of viral defense system
MISDENIKKIAAKNQTTELNVLREYFQHLFLSHFYQQKETEKIYFKGGTALRIIYNSPRFSEDLDFSSSLKNVSSIEHAVVETLIEVEKEGIDAGIAEAKKTSGGYLAKINFKSGNKDVSIQMEISLREGEKSGEITTIASDFILPYTITQLSQEQLVDEKIRALLNREKPRDFYDLYFILRANLLTAEKKSILHEVKDITLKQSKINFSRELKQFLPKSHWSVIHNFPGILDREVNRFL